MEWTNRLSPEMFGTLYVMVFGDDTIQIFRKDTKLVDPLVECKSPHKHKKDGIMALELILALSLKSSKVQ